MGFPKHGMSRTREYHIWKGMIDRCEHKRKASAQYFNKIKISPELRQFEGFYKILGPCPEGLTLDRIDNSGDYAPGNVRWATYKQQARNRSNTTRIEFMGKTQSLVEWSEELGIPYDRISRRINTYKWPVQRALTEGLYAKQKSASSKDSLGRWKPETIE